MSEGTNLYMIGHENCGHNSTVERYVYVKDYDLNTCIDCGKKIRWETEDGKRVDYQR